MAGSLVMGRRREDCSKLLKESTSVIAPDSLNPEVMRYTCRASQCLPYVYFANAKCASSTIQTTVLRQEVRLGFRPFFPESGQNATGYAYFQNDFATLKHIGERFGFTFVRNPFARALSVYLDKIMSPKDAVAERFFRYFPDESRDLSFGRFLERISTLHPMQMDPHWRPQSYNIAYGFLRYDLIGHVERFNEHFAEAWRAIFDAPVDPLRVTHNETRAADKLRRYYGDGEADLVRAIYSADFVNFGYGTRIEDASSVPSALPNHRFDPTALQDYAAALEAMESNRPADALPIMKRLIRQLPENPYFQETLALCRAALGHRWRALRAIERAIEICPQLPRFRETRERLRQAASPR